MVAFIGSVAVASTISANEMISKTEMTDGGKDKKKKKCAKDCAKDCCTKAEGTATKVACSKDAKKACCAKKKAEAAKEVEAK